MKLIFGMQAVVFSVWVRMTRLWPMEHLTVILDALKKILNAFLCSELLSSEVCLK